MNASESTAKIRRDSFKSEIESAECRQKKVDLIKLPIFISLYSYLLQNT